MPDLFQRILRNANVGICLMLDRVNRQFVYVTDFAKDHARLCLAPVVGRR